MLGPLSSFNYWGARRSNWFFFLNDGWVRDALFVLGGTICALGFYLGIVFRANDKKSASQEGEEGG